MATLQTAIEAPSRRPRRAAERVPPQVAAPARRRARRRWPQRLHELAEAFAWARLLG